MQYIIEFLVFLAVFFIAIGDGVILLFRFIAKNFQRGVNRIKQALGTVVESAKTIQFPKISLSLPHRRMSKVHDVFVRTTQNYSLMPAKKRTQRKKYKKRSPRFAVPLFSKLKYFIAGLFFAFVFIFFPLLSWVYIQSLPNPQELSNRQIAQTTKIYDRNKTLLYQIYANQNRTVVPLSDIPKQLQEATIAIEDKDFYKHPGFDITAIIRSFISNVSGGELQGGSTITQQLIKSALLSPETSLSRKLKEAILAFWSERIYNKNQILEMYFNQVPYGGTAWGVEAASEVYFDKNVKDLSLAESAFLAGIPRAPTIYSPYGATPNAWKKRQTEVLKRMQELGYITKAQYDQAVKEKLDFAPPRTPLLAPHFVMYVKDVLEKTYGLPLVEKGGLTVITSLDLKLQEEVQKMVATEVQNSEYLQLSNGAALVTDPRNGDILAMVGSKDYYQEGSGNVNLTRALRQPGSSIKVVTYSAALANGMTAASIIDDSPVTYSNAWESYSPVNYDGRFHGRVPFRLALANSFNIPAVKILNQIGIDTMVNTAKTMGVTSWDDSSRFGLSLTLGGGEVTMLDMMAVYGTLANGGVRVDPNPILKITDTKGSVLEEKPETEKIQERGRQVLDPGIAFIISDILADNNARSMAFGTNSILNIPGKYVSVKTGTTDNKRDNWTFGYTKDYAVGVWVGNNDNTPMNPALTSGITGAAPIWSKIINHVLKEKDAPRPTPPPNVIQKSCGGRVEYFLQGTENSVNCNFIPNSQPPSNQPRR